MTLISKQFADELSEKEMRDAFVAAQTRTKVTSQIRANRIQRDWSQGDFAKRLNKPQSNISRIENREYGSFTLSTLLELAAAFDVALNVEFVPYDEFLRKTKDLSPETLVVKSFDRGALDYVCHEPTLPVEKAAVEYEPVQVGQIIPDPRTINQIDSAPRLMGISAQEVDKGNWNYLGLETECLIKRAPNNLVSNLSPQLPQISTFNNLGRSDISALCGVN